MELQGAIQNPMQRTTLRKARATQLAKETADTKPSKKKGKVVEGKEEQPAQLVSRTSGGTPRTRAQSMYAVRSVKALQNLVTSNQLQGNRSDYTDRRCNTMQKTDQIDPVADGWIPKDIPPEVRDDMAPIECYGDGNCLYRAASRLTYGSEEHYEGLKCEAVAEVYENIEWYSNPDNHLKGFTGTLHGRVMPLGVTPLELYLMMEEDDLKPKRKRKEKRDLRSRVLNSVFNMSRRDAYASALMVQALASVLERPILLVHPEFGSYSNPSPQRAAHHRYFYPRLGDKSDERRIVIMWSSMKKIPLEKIGNNLDKMNHFVPMVLKQVNNARKAPKQKQEQQGKKAQRGVRRLRRKEAEEAMNIPNSPAGEKGNDKVAMGEQPGQLKLKETEKEKKQKEQVRSVEKKNPPEEDQSKANLTERVEKMSPPEGLVGSRGEEQSKDEGENLEDQSKAGEKENNVTMERKEDKPSHGGEKVKVDQVAAGDQLVGPEDSVPIPELTKRKEDEPSHEGEKVEVPILELTKRKEDEPSHEGEKVDQVAAGDQLVEPEDSVPIPELTKRKEDEPSHEGEKVEVPIPELTKRKEDEPSHEGEKVEVPILELTKRKEDEPSHEGEKVDQVAAGDQLVEPEDSVPIPELTKRKEDEPSHEGEKVEVPIPELTKRKEDKPSHEGEKVDQVAAGDQLVEPEDSVPIHKQQREELKQKEQKELTTNKAEEATQNHKSQEGEKGNNEVAMGKQPGQLKLKEDNNKHSQRAEEGDGAKKMNPPEELVGSLGEQNEQSKDGEGEKRSRKQKREEELGRVRKG